MKIRQHYERLKNLGNYENVKIGVTLETDLTDTSAANIKKVSECLLSKCKELVITELKQED